MAKALGLRQSLLAEVGVWKNRPQVPFALSLSKGVGVWFDKLTTNGYW